MMMQVLLFTALLCLAGVSKAYRTPNIVTRRNSKLGKIVKKSSLSLYSTPTPSITASTEVKKRVYTSEQTIIGKILLLWKKLYMLTIGNIVSLFLAFFKRVTDFLGLKKSDKKIDTKIDTKSEKKSEKKSVDEPPKESLSTVMQMWKDESKDVASSNIVSNDDASIKVTVKKVDENQWVEKKLKEIETLEVDTKATVTTPIVTEEAAEDATGPYDFNAVMSFEVDKKVAVTPTLAETSVEAEDVTGPYDFNAVMSTDFIPSTIKVPKSGGNSFDIVKSKGTSGIISYVITEVMFWALVIPIIIASYHGSNQEWLNFANTEDRAKIFALAGVYVTSIRLAVPLRLGVAVAIIPWVEENITNNFSNDTKQ